MYWNISLVASVGWTAVGKAGVGRPGRRRLWGRRGGALPCPAPVAPPRGRGEAVGDLEEGRRSGRARVQRTWLNCLSWGR